MTENIKELLLKYQEGAATSAEKKIVEEKLATLNLLQELQEGQVMQAKPQLKDRFNPQKVKRQVNAKFFKVTLLLFIFAGLVLAMLHVVVPTIVDQFYYNPMTKAKEAPVAEYNLVATTYTELTNPLLRVQEIQIDPLGMGRYTVTTRYQTTMNIGEASPLTCSYQLVRGKVSATSHPSNNVPNFTALIPAKANGDYESAYQATLVKLNALPEASEVVGSLTFRQPLTVSQLFQFLQVEKLPEAADYQLAWLQVDTGSADSFGFSWNEGEYAAGDLLRNVGNKYFTDLNQQYPWLFPATYRQYSFTDMPQLFSQHFTSSLAYLTDHQKIIFSLPVSEQSTNFAAALDYVQENGVKISGIYLAGTAKKFTLLAQQAEVGAVNVLGSSLYSAKYQND
ncbi:anti sigma factor C-terminal domain-containing protein [Enterococcus nangangensis]|uniref:anti sigma factor C-terminal domain-containing protein n=1 Tax=Enterococcus nangangensis TaxID=2559926 RepID=UPI0010F65DF0|nr:anti sigma factor C-terminal domain-containing protein [Enterococcus nangangensis]